MLDFLYIMTTILNMWVKGRCLRRDNTCCSPPLGSAVGPGYTEGSRVGLKTRGGIMCHLDTRTPHAVKPSGQHAFSTFFKFMAQAVIELYV